MTIDLLTKLAVVTLLLIGLDLLLLRFRREQAGKKLPLVETLTGVFDRVSARIERLQTALTNPRQSFKLPTSLPAIKWKKSAPITDSVTSQPDAESVISTTPAPEYEIQTASGNVARVHITADVPPGTVIYITISTDPEGRASVQQAQVPVTRRTARRIRSFAFPALPDLRPGLRALLELPAARLASGLFIIALGLYLLTRLIGLTNFPIYFFGDEAVQTVSAADLVRHGLRGPNGAFLPTFFQNGIYYNLSLSVYLQVIPHLIFGNSIFVTRGTSVLVTLLAVFSVGMLLRNAFGAKYWWLGALLLSVVPAWFLHSRTAFETALFVSFYAAFLYFYLEYRLHNPKRVYWAVLMAGLAFYSYSPGQLIMAVTGVFLLFNDLKYHWQQRNTLLNALGLVALIALPYLRFRLTVDYSPLDHLRELGSYWIDPIPLSEKIVNYITQYTYGLSPQYWFSDTATDLVRHQMLGYGNLPRWFFPFILIGLVVALIRGLRSSAYRVVILAALAAPSGAALAQIGITRVLVFVIPASLLTAIGLNFLLEETEKLLSRQEWGFFSKPAFSNVLALSFFTILVSLNIYMLADALSKGPTWYTDYGLYGMQYGAKQVYQETVVPILKQDPNARFVITPSWANGAEQFVGFFVPQQYQSRVMLGQIYDLLPQHPQLTDKNYFVVTPEEHDKIVQDPKFKQVIERSIIKYPDGRPGFYVLNLQLADNFDAILAQEEETRRKPVEETFDWNGETVRVIHSPFGGGSLKDLMDGDTETLAKGAEANPLILEYFFPNPIKASQLVLTTGSMQNFDVSIQVYAPGSDQSIGYTKTFVGLPPDPTVTIPFTNGPAEFDHILISILDHGQGQIAQVHVREIQFK